MEAGVRRLLVSITLAMSLVALSATTALAAAPEGAQKAPIFGPNIFLNVGGFSCPTGATPTANTFGFGVLSTSGTETTLSAEVALKGAASNTTYNVFDLQDPGKCPTISPPDGRIMTNAEGAGNVHFTVPRVPTATEFWVVVQNVPRNEDYGSSAVPLD